MTSKQSDHQNLISNSISTDPMDQDQLDQLDADQLDNDQSSSSTGKFWWNWYFLIYVLERKISLDSTWAYKLAKFSRSDFGSVNSRIEIAIFYIAMIN